MPRVSFNPYEAPAQEPGAPQDPQMRGRLLQAAIVAWLASAYWALMTALISMGVAFGSASGSALLFPVVLIGLYAYRGYQVFKGDQAAATGLLVLHGVGGAVSIFQLFTGDPVVTALTAVKVAIHVAGCITAVRVRALA